MILGLLDDRAAGVGRRAARIRRHPAAGLDRDDGRAASESLILIFAVIKMLTILGDEATIWSWIGLALAILIAVGAFQTVQEAGGVDTLRSEIPNRTASTTMDARSADVPAAACARGGSATSRQRRRHRSHRRPPSRSRYGTSRRLHPTSPATTARRSSIEGKDAPRRDCILAACPPENAAKSAIREYRL